MNLFKKTTTSFTETLTIEQEKLNAKKLISQYFTHAKSNIK